MTTQLAVQELEFEPLTAEEMQQCVGGSVWKVITPVGLAIFVIENWADIKKGVSEGFMLE